MIAAVHQEACAGRDRAEAPDHEAIAQEGEVIQDVVEEGARPSRIVVVGVVADLDVRWQVEVADEGDPRMVRQRVPLAGIRSGTRIVGHAGS